MIAIEPPIPLQRDLPESSRFPVEALGLMLSEVVRCLHRGVQAPEAICAQSTLAVVTLVAQAQIDVEIDGRIRPTSNYFMTLGESGERKSAVDSEASRAVREYEERVNEQYAGELRDFKSADEAYRRAKEEELRGSKRLSVGERMRKIKNLGPPLLPPLLPNVLVDEPTYEGLVMQFANGRPSLGLFTDEGGRMIGGYGLSQDHQLKTAAGLSELWDGKRISRIRGTTEMLLLYGRRLSMHLMAQPKIAQLFLGNQLFSEQGLLSRCLVVFPKSTVGNRMYRSHNLRDDPVMKEFHSRIGGILALPFPMANGERNSLKPRAIGMTSEAKQEWIAFHNEIEKQVGTNGKFSAVRGLANKAAEHAYRLAASLAFFDDPGLVEVDRMHMSSGIELMHYYLGEALRLFLAGAIDPRIEMAAKLLTWTRSMREVYFPQIYQFGPNSIRTKARAQECVDILVEHGWLTEVKGGRVIEGVKRSRVWRVWHDIN